MLIGRQVELATLDRLLDGVLAGQGGALVVHGEAGIGKSALLEALRERTADRGAAVLLARGVESEAEVAFSTLGDLLGPLLGDLGSLPAPQSAALAGALALAPPEPGGRFAVCVATLGLLLRAAARRPLLVIVDDLHWVDASSQECLRYAARRCTGPLAVVLAVRHGDAVRSVADLPRLPVAALTPASARDLLADVAPDLARTVADEVVEAAAGLPLALRELPAALEPGQRTGLTPLGVPLPPGPLLHEVYGRRIDALPDAVRRALQVAAAYEGDELRVLAPACAAVGTGADQLAAAETAGLLRMADGRLAFTHPLVRSAAYHGAAPAERRRAHAALADLLSGQQRAWHLSAAALGPDEAVAAELERSAAATLAKRAPGPASLAFERAARLSRGVAPFTRRLLAAGETAAAAGLPERALILLQEVGAVDDGASRAPARHLQALTLLWTRGVEPAVDILVHEAGRIETTAPARAAAMLADASLSCNVAADTARALEIAQRAAALLRDQTDPLVRTHVLSALGWALLLRGRGREARDVIAEVEVLASENDQVSPTGDALKGLLHAHLVAGELERADAESRALCARARTAGAIAALPNLLVVVADCAYRTGNWDAADVALAEAAVTGDETGQPTRAGLAGVIAARLSAARGLEDECRDSLRAVIAAAEAMGMRSGLYYARAALGFLELGLSRVDAAVEPLEWVAHSAEKDGFEEPTLIPWAPDLIEAYLRAGRLQDARAALEVLGRRAAAADTTTASALHQRCRGLVEDRFDDGFRSALELDDQRPMPFERARTLLAYGRRLHRARRRSEARERLHEAVSGFERLGATPWTAQSRAELLAAGGRRRPVPGPDLTAQERRVARAVVQGASNRDIAAELFLSPKTVEFHLGRIYRKLNIRSRTQLAAILDTRPDPQRDA